MKLTRTDWRCLNAEEREKMRIRVLRLSREQHLSVTIIAARFDVARSVIQRILRENGDGR